MSALMQDLDLGNTNPDAVEQSMASGGLAPEGKHHAVLNGCREVQANSGSVGRELTFRILAGPGAGQDVRETVWITSDPKAKNRRVLFMHRLGLLKKVAAEGGKSAYVPAEGKTDFMDCLGAECVIDVKHEEDTWTDKKTGKPRTGTKAVLSFEGVLSLDDKRCADVPRGKPGAAQAAVATAAAAGAKAKDDFSDL